MAKGGVAKSRLHRAAVAIPHLLREHPEATPVITVAVASIHAGLRQLGFPSPFRRLAEGESSAQALYLSIGSAGAPLAGFAGVVVVFALGDRKQLRVLRAKGERRLAITWVALFVMPFTSLLLGLSAALMVSIGAGYWAPYVAEVAILLLVAIVGADDSQEQHRSNVIRTSSVPFE